MSSKISQAGKDLQLTEDDFRDIRLAEERSRLLSIIGGVIVVVGSTIAGYVAGVNYLPSQGYPYSAVAVGPLMAARGHKRKWLLGVILAVLAFVCFTIGTAIGSPSLGVVTYYGAHYQKT